MWERGEILDKKMIKMKPAMFRYKMALAEYSDYDIALINECIGGNGPVTLDDCRYAVYEYAKVSKNVQMIPLYVGLVESLYLNSDFSWEDAVGWVLKIVVGWGL